MKQKIYNFHQTGVKIKERKTHLINKKWLKKQKYSIVDVKAHKKTSTFLYYNFII